MSEQKTENENGNLMHEAQPQDVEALRDLPLQKLTEAEADDAEEIKGGATGRRQYSPMNFRKDTDRSSP